MDKFMHFVEDKMSPIADKLGEQRHLSAMQKGFMTVLPLIFVGAVFMVIANPPVTADMVKSGGVWSIFSGWFNFATKYKMAILVPYNMSMGLLALAVTFVIADNLATSYSMKGITNGLTALVVFLLVAAPANYLALADPTRREILNLLKQSRMSAGDIVKYFSISGAAISRHLSVLKEAGLIRDEREGKFIYYELNATVLEEIMLWISELKGDTKND